MKKTIITLAAIAMAALSCSKLEPADVTQPLFPARISAISTETRTTFDSEGKYSWCAGDAVSVFVADGTQCPTAFTADEAGTCVSFSGSKASESDVLSYALYPYSAAATCTSAGVVRTVIPTEQDGTIASVISVAANDGSGNFAFSNVTSIVKMHINASDNIRYVRIEFATEVAGEIEIAADGSVSGATAKTVSLSSTTALDGDYYFTVAPVAAGKIILYFRNLAGDTAIKRATLSKACSANTVKNLGTVCGLDFIVGGLPGLFSTQANTQYVFSKGNLRYQASTGSFAFADKQYTVLGPNVAGNNVGDAATRQTQSKWIDLFCWGTSGYDYGATKYQPWSLWGADGAQCGKGTVNLSGNMDWGYNPIVNGGNTENYGWTTPSVGNLNYLKGTVSGRTSRLFTKGTVAGVKGLFFIPDVWTCPASVTPPASYNNATSSAAWSANDWTADDWKILEDSGLVFIPCGGWIGTGGAKNGESTQIKLWSSTQSASTKAYMMTYANGEFYSNAEGTRSSQASVRLIKTVE